MGGKKTTQFRKKKIEFGKNQTYFIGLRFCYETNKKNETMKEETRINIKKICRYLLQCSDNSSVHSSTSDLNRAEHHEEK